MIPNKTSTLVYRVVVYTDITLEQFIFNTPNCICTYKNRWRCTYHGPNYSMNVFTAKDIGRNGVVCMFFTKTDDMETFFPEFKRLFGAEPLPENITFINRVEKFYTPYREIYFDGLYDDLDHTEDIGEFFIIQHGAKKKKEPKKLPAKIPSYVQQLNSEEVDEDDSDMEHQPASKKLKHSDDFKPHLSMDLQRFCAMMVQPFPEESNVKIEIFDSGVLNVAGIPSQEYFERIKKFIDDKLVPLLKNNCSYVENHNIELEDDEETEVHCM